MSSAAVPATPTIEIPLPVPIALPPGSRAVWTPGHVTVCSVYPEKLTKQMVHIGFHTYELGPPDPQLGYAVVRVYDNFQLIRNPYSLNAEETVPAPQSCMSIAESLVQYWAGDIIGANAGRSVGVGVIQGETPTTEELAILQNKQSEYFRYLVNEADSYWARDESKYIDAVHRLALRWLGSEDRPWYKRVDQVLLKPCLACGETIRQQAAVCKHCQTNLPEYYLKLGYRPTAEEDAHVLGIMERMNVMDALAKPSKVPDPVTWKEDRPRARS